MCFETAGSELNPLLPPLVAFSISFFTSMGGVSGAFLLLPFQISLLGFAAPSVSATNQLYNVLAIPSGVYRYARESRLLWPLAGVIIAGSVPGVLLGTWIRVVYLPDSGFFKIFAGFVLLLLGFRILFDLKVGGNDKIFPRKDGLVQSTGLSLKSAGFRFGNCSYEFSPSLLFLICLSTGVVGGIYGVGGGAFIAPVLVSFFRLPIYVVAGATLLGTFASSLTSVAFFELLAGAYTGLSVAPDWKLGILFGLGGGVGIYLGGRCQKFVPERPIKLVLFACVLVLAIRYLSTLFW